MSNRPYRCDQCNAAGGDLGELEEHLLTAGHGPADAEHATERVTEQRVAQARREQTWQRIADAAGVTVDELREALR